MVLAKNNYYTDNTTEKIRSNLSKITKANVWAGDKDNLKALIGDVELNSFKVINISRRGRSIYPIAHGVMEKQGGKTKVNVRVEVKNKLLAIYLVLVCILGIAIISFANNSKYFFCL